MSKTVVKGRGFGKKYTKEGWPKKCFAYRIGGGGGGVFYMFIKNYVQYGEFFKNAG